MWAKATTAFRRPAAAPALILCVLVAAICVACGSNGGSADSYAGYWRLPSGSLAALTGYRLLAVRSSGDSYQARFDTLAWHTAEIVDGRLRVQVRYAKDPMFAPELDLETAGGKGVLLMSVSSSPLPSSLTRLSEAQYCTRLDAMADRELPTTLCALSWLAKEWATKHGSPPARYDMTAHSAFGRYVAKRFGLWPRNPFTGEAIHAGGEPGDFSYWTDGRRFKLTAVSSHGSTVRSGPTPTP